MFARAPRVGFEVVLDGGGVYGAEDEFLLFLSRFLPTEEAFQAAGRGLRAAAAVALLDRGHPRGLGLGRGDAAAAGDGWGGAGRLGAAVSARVDVGVVVGEGLLGDCGHACGDVKGECVLMSRYCNEVSVEVFPPAQGEGDPDHDDEGHRLNTPQEQETISYQYLSVCC